jgi:hypothetical protein
MTTIYETYSDASYRAGLDRAAFGVFVARPGAQPITMAGLIHALNNTEAEFAAIVIGMKMVPTDAGGIAYHDQLALARMIRDRSPLVHDIVRQVERTGMQLQYVDRGSRSIAFALCHRMAYRKLLRYSKRRKVG